MSEQNLDNNEQTYMEGAGSYAKSTLNVIQGTFYLTSKRFMFCKRSGLFDALTGPLLMHLAKGTHLVFEIELSKLKSITYKKHGFGKLLCFINSNNEEFLLVFTTSKEKWLSTIMDVVIRNNPTTKIEQIGEYYSFSVVAEEMKSNGKKSDEALAELKKAKDKFDLGLITQSEYESKKEELRKFIN
ncbi:MAG: SHOCT domain-containing protein [Acholeplasmataceae bacterium]|nr:SHOCT domain-containing protein [Acholeplasmataceae bacterium]